MKGLLIYTIAFKSIIDHMEFSETNVTELVLASSSAFEMYYATLQCITRPENPQPSTVRPLVFSDVTKVHDRTRAAFSSLAIAVGQYSLEKALRSNGPASAFVDRLLLSLIFQSAKDGNHVRAIETLNTSFNGT